MASSILIKGGRIVDGTGNPWYYGDVRVAGERIAEVGRLCRSKADRIIDAEGLYVSPGFFDMHSHTDLTLIANPHLEYKIRQGITFEVNGNCGCSPLPSAEAAKKGFSAGASPFFIDIPDSELDWKTPDEYFSKLEQRKIGLNVLTFAGHASLRMLVMPKKKKPANTEELEEMKRLLHQCMKAGAYGFSAKLCVPPGIYSDFNEIVELCKVAAKYHGVYSVDSRHFGHDIVKGVEDDVTVAKAAKIPVQISHLILLNKQNMNRSKEVLEVVDGARKREIDATADTIPLVNAVGEGPAWAVLPSRFHKEYATKLARKFGKRAKGRGLAKAYGEFEAAMSAYWAKKLSDPDFYRQVKREMLYGKPDIEKNSWGYWNFVESYAATHVPNHPQWEGKSGAEIAGLFGGDPLDIYLELAKEAVNGARVSNWQQSENDVRNILTHPAVSLCTDAVPCEFKGAPRSGGAFPFALRRFVTEEKLLPLEDMVRKMTSLPASKFRLFDRGLIRPGGFADIVVFKFEEVRETAAFGAPCASAKGMRHVMVNGQLVLDNQKLTDALPGKVVKLEKGVCQTSFAGNMRPNPH